MDRWLILFAREPSREARAKGLGSPAAAELFAGFARGWAEAARDAGARLALASPPEDRAAWRRTLADSAGGVWLTQRGSSFGERLEDAARQAAALGGHAVLVGGDVPPAPGALRAAFEGLESGADAAVSPAPDGGVSLLALGPADTDLLHGMRPRRRTVLRDLLRALRRRGRRVELVGAIPDLDGPRGLRALRHRFPAGHPLRCLVQSLLRGSPRLESPRPWFSRRWAQAAPSGLRAPPAVIPA